MRFKALSKQRILILGNYHVVAAILTCFVRRQRHVDPKCQKWLPEYDAVIEVDQLGKILGQSRRDGEESRGVV